jgi:hypothetical protein
MERERVVLNAPRRIPFPPPPPTGPWTVLFFIINKKNWNKIHLQFCLSYYINKQKWTFQLKHMIICLQLM